jgi:SAM-dependent methyltransferase
MAQDHFSSTQYNSISAEYDAVNDLPISRAIVVNIERVLGPHIRGAKVLELACGTGFFTRHLLDQDASSVVAVDISQAMVDIAQGEASKRPGDEGKCRFMVADCTAPFAAGEEGSFDLVFAAWLLNYAADEAQMTAMWKNISKHLKPGGRFVGVAPHPEEDPTVSDKKVSLTQVVEVCTTAVGA